MEAGSSSRGYPELTFELVRLRDLGPLVDLPTAVQLGPDDEVAVVSRTAVAGTHRVAEHRRHPAVWQDDGALEVSELDPGRARCPGEIAVVPLIRLHPLSPLEV